MKYLLTIMASLMLLSACEGGSTTYSYPEDNDDERQAARGKLTGEGLVLGGGSDKDEDSGGGIGVNSFLWRATLDTLSFMPLASADPFGGVILTDWYEDPKTPGERFKINALIIGGRLQANALKVSLFRQTLDTAGAWRDAEVNPARSREIEDTIFTRARQLRVAQISN